MQPIKDLLNKIKWDKKLNPEDYDLFYLDRVSKNYNKLNYTEIKRIEDNFLIIEKNGEETNIPLHRIKQVNRKDEVVWKR